ncbi:MAG: type I-PGING CRISPR-associated protein Cas5p [Candidatus Cloacimonetes bacterium]|nr:type I-PGING CRISPR-associated protein Cas5p [Candidatus Cloacimonadota bacterium]MDY0230841.1 type I-PGING CRISPR-associated protein Cas5p [Candidatus Cloacimonadaceae bacterium]
MENLDLSILKKIPELNVKVVLEIEPLAPLSMVSELPGSYYKTLKSPDKKMLCGLFENILGWHIDLPDRKAIVKELSRLRKVQAKMKPELSFSDNTKGSSFCPLLMDYFEIALPIIPEISFYDDLWRKSFRRSDASVHPKGTPNINHNLIPLKRQLKRSEKNPKQVDDKSLEDFFKENIEQFPQYYTSPTAREYVYTKGLYEIRIDIDRHLYTTLKERLINENIGYLGNSEGWVNLNITEL